MNKISYALGLGIAHQLKSMGIEDFSVEDFSQSVSDVLADKTPAMTNREAQELLNDYFQKKQKEGAEKAIAEGKVFLEATGKREGVTPTKRGLQNEVHTPRPGARRPPAPDTVVCHYEGRLVSGKVFDSSYERNQPAEFGLNQVIPGWTEGLQLMSEGAKFRFYIPYLLGYGEQGAGPSIPPYSTLVFDVELISVK